MWNSEILLIIYVGIYVFIVIYVQFHMDSFMLKMLVRKY
jgi:hypothetical protein